MKAVSYTKYGPADVLQIVDVDTPTPKNNEVLIEVYATTVNRTDSGLRSANYFVSRFFTGLLRPKQPVMGSEFAGKVVKIGADVTEFAVGDKVFGFDDTRGAAHAEYMVLPSDGPIATMPRGTTYKQMAAAGEGATYALSDIFAANVRRGQNVLVYGASGAIGSAAVQIVQHLGAQVIAVCGTNAVALIKSLGVRDVVDYQKIDFTQTDKKYDLVFDAVGKSSYGVCKKLLKPGGTYCSTELGKGGQNPLLAILFSITRSKRVIFPIPKINKEKIEYIKAMIETGAFTPLIDREYPIDRIVEAAKYVDSGQKIGNVVITIK